MYRKYCTDTSDFNPITRKATKIKYAALPLMPYKNPKFVRKFLFTAGILFHHMSSYKNKSTEKRIGYENRGQFASTHYAEDAEATHHGREANTKYGQKALYAVGLAPVWVKETERKMTKKTLV